MDLKEIIESIVMTILIPAIPVVVGYVVKFMKAKADAAINQINSSTIKEIINNATDIVFAVVESTTQTYVSELKKQGEFTKEAQKNAFEMAYNSALLMITSESQEAIAEIYGDFDEWLSLKIEQLVLETKS